MFRNEVLSSVEHSLEQSSPNNILGEQAVDVNYTASNESLSIESGYIAGSAYFQSSSHVYEEQFTEYAPDIYSDSYIVEDGSQVVPIYYPIPTYYQIYNGVSAVENNGTTFYNYYQFAVPLYCLFSDVTTENSITSDGTSASYTDEFTNEIVENAYEDSSSHQATLSSNNDNYVADNGRSEELIDEFAENCDELRGSLLPVPENDFMAEESKKEVEMKKDWLYLLALSGKLRLKARIPDVQIFTAIIEEEKENDEEAESSESPVVDNESFEDISPKIEESYGDQDKKNPDEDEIEKCHANGDENDVWKDFFCTIDDPVFGIEACFSNGSENESSDIDLDKKNFNLSSTYGKTFMILGRLNKQIEILPTIEEEEEPVVKSENLHVMVQKTPHEIDQEISIGLEEECFKSKQQNAEKVENICGLPEATVEKNPNEDDIELSYGNGAHKEKCQASGEENDIWKDFFYSIDDPVFGIEACFNNGFEKEPCDNDLDKKNFNLSSTNGKTFMILGRLNKQIEVLPTIEEEEEQVVESENLHVTAQKTPHEVNQEISTDLEEECFESKQENAEKVENNYGLPEATVEALLKSQRRKDVRESGDSSRSSEVASGRVKIHRGD